MQQNIKEQPRMTFSEAIKRNLNNLINFNGRARRSELWWNYLAYFILSCIVGIILGGSTAISSIVSLLLELCIVAVTIRRLHDSGHSGYWVIASVLLSVIAQINLSTSGFYEITNTLNPNPEEIINMISQPSFIGLGIISFIVNICILVFALQDSKPEENKYGKSPKYIIEEEL